MAGVFFFAGAKVRCSYCVRFDRGLPVVVWVDYCGRDTNSLLIYHCHTHVFRKYGSMEQIKGREVSIDYSGIFSGVSDLIGRTDGRTDGRTNTKIIFFFFPFQRYVPPPPRTLPPLSTTGYINIFGYVNVFNRVC